MKKLHPTFSFAVLLAVTLTATPLFADRDDSDRDDRDESDAWDLYDRNREQRNFNPYNYPDEESSLEPNNYDSYYYREQGPYHIHPQNDANSNYNNR